MYALYSQPYNRLFLPTLAIRFISPTSTATIGSSTGTSAQGSGPSSNCSRGLLQTPLMGQNKPSLSGDRPANSLSAPFSACRRRLHWSKAEVTADEPLSSSALTCCRTEIYARGCLRFRPAAALSSTLHHTP